VALTHAVNPGINHFSQQSNDAANIPKAYDQVIKPKWSVEVSGAFIVDTYFGEFVQNDSTPEIAVALNDSTTIIYNYSESDSIGTEIGRLTFDATDPNSLVLENYFVTYDPITNMVAFYNLTHRIELSGPANAFSPVTGDLNGDGIDDVVFWNQTTIFVYFVYHYNIISRTITKNDLSLIDSSDLFLSDFYVLEDVYNISSGSLLLVSFIDNILGSNYLNASLIKIDELSFVYSNLDLGTTLTSSTDFIDIIYFDPVLEDSRIEYGAVYKSGLDEIVKIFSFNKSFDELTNKSLTYRTVYTFTHINPLVQDEVENDYWIRLNDYSQLDAYGVTRQYLIKPSKYSSGRFLYLYYYNLTTRTINETKVGRIPLDMKYAVGLVETMHKDTVEDLIIPATGYSEIYVFPCSWLRDGNNTSLTEFTSRVVYDVEILDIPTKSEDLIVTGENEYITVYYTPDFHVTYFQGLPSTSVFELKKYNITKDGVLDFLAIYQNWDTGKYGVYVFNSDGDAPNIDKVEFSPFRMTSLDYVEVRVWVSDNLGVFSVSGYYTTYRDGILHQSYQVPFQQSQDGSYYYAILNPVKMFPVLADYTSDLTIFARDLFGNQNSTVKYLTFYSSLEAESDFKVFKYYNNAIEFPLKWVYDGDLDRKDEAYIVALVNALPSIGDYIFTYVDYSDIAPYNRTWEYNSSVDGKIVGGGVGLSDSDSPVAVLVTEKKIDLFYGNLSKKFNTTNLARTAIFSRISDYDGDGYGELLLIYNDSLEIFDIYLNSTRALASAFKLNGNFSYLIDTIALNRYIYVSKTGSTDVIQIYNSSGLVKQLILTNKTAYSKNGYVFQPFKSKVLALISNGSLLVLNMDQMKVYSIGTTFTSYNFSESYITDDEYIYLADNKGGIYIYNSSFQQVYKNNALYGSMPSSLALGRLENETQREFVVMYSEKFLDFFNIGANKTSYLHVSLPWPILGGDFDKYTEYETLLIYDEGVVFVHDLYKYYGLYPIVTNLYYSYNQGQQINAYIELKNIFGDSVTDASVKAIVKSPDGIEFFFDAVNLGWGYYEIVISTDGFIYGNYNMSIMIIHDYYRDYILNYTFVLRPIMDILAEYEYYGEHGKDLIIDFSVVDIYRYPVYNATGNVTIDSLFANIYYNSTTGFYEAKFNSSDLNSLPMGYYGITIFVNHALAAQPVSFSSLLYLQSKLSVNVSITPRSIQQGDNFTVTVEVKDYANYSVSYASIEIYYRDIYIFDYSNSSGLFEFIESTEFWEAGNYSIDLYIYHDLSTNVYNERFYLVVTAIPSLDIEFDYLGIGLDSVYVNLLDRYNYTLIDGTLIMELEGKNYTLNNTGSFRFEFNFTEIAAKWNFSVYFYLINSSFAPEKKFGPYYIDVLINGRVTIHEIISENGSPILYQGDRVNITVYATDSFGNPVNQLYVNGYIFISGIPYPLNSLGNGYYFALIDTNTWRYGTQFFEVYIFWDRFYHGYTYVNSNLNLTAIPKVLVSSSRSYGNKSVQIDFRVIDKFGNPIEDAELTITFEKFNLKVPVSLGQASVLMDFSNKIVGERQFNVSISGTLVQSKEFHFAISVKTEINKENVKINALGLLTNDTGEYPANAIIQGETLYVNITVLDNDGLYIPNLRVRVIFGGTSYSVATSSGKVFMVQIITENMPAGHYPLIVQVSGPFIILQSGSILSIDEVIYIKPEIHYKVDIPESIVEGQEFNVTVNIKDKYGNPLEPIEGRTNVVVIFGKEEHVATYYPNERAFIVTLTAPIIGEDEIVESYPITVLIDYEGIGKTNAIRGQKILSIQATPPITEETLQTSSNVVWLLAILATLIVLTIYLLIRYKAFDEKIMKLTYLLIVFGAVGSFFFSLGLFAIKEYGYAEFAALVSFMAIFPWYGLQIRLDQLKLIKASQRLIEGSSDAEIHINKLNYLIIYLFGALAIYIAFDVIGDKITWFSRYILAGLRTPIGLYFITAQTIAFYLFAARGIYMKSLNYFDEMANKKIPSIQYASSRKDKFLLFQDIVADSIRVMGSYVLTTAVYTLYLLSTTIWGVSRLPSLGLSPITIVLLLTPITIPIILIWVLQYIKLPKEPSVREFVFSNENIIKSADDVSDTHDEDF